jgi:hypothetical protein
MMDRNPHELIDVDDSWPERWEACEACGYLYRYPHLCRQHRLCGLYHPPMPNDRSEAAMIEQNADYERMTPEQAYHWGVQVGRRAEALGLPVGNERGVGEPCPDCGLPWPCGRHLCPTDPRRDGGPEEFDQVHDDWGRLT